MGRRVHRHPRSREKIPRPRHQHADRRARLLRRRDRRGDHGIKADRRRAVRRLPVPRQRPDHQQRREAALHVGRADQSADGDARPGRRDRPRLPARPEHGALFHRRSRPQGRRPVERLRRQGAAQGRRPRRQSRDDLRAQAALWLEGRARRAGRGRRDERHSRRGLRRSARQGVGRADGIGCDSSRLALDVALRGAGGGATRRRRDRRRNDRPQELSRRSISQRWKPRPARPDGW